MVPWPQPLMLIFLFTPHLTCASAGRSFKGTKDDLPPEFETFYYTQTVDHFNYNPESYQTFQQRYLLNFKYWGGANTSSPIFVYTGADIDVTRALPRIGFIGDLAARFNGLQLYIENIKSALGNFGSNIIFSNGLRDPYSAGGVLEDLSDTVVAIYTEQGAHCLDMHASKTEDPDWLFAQREKEIKIIAFWIAQYNSNLPGNA